MRPAIPPPQIFYLLHASPKVTTVDTVGASGYVVWPPPQIFYLIHASPKVTTVDTVGASGYVVWGKL